jgi:hypothetical protein
MNFLDKMMAKTCWAISSVQTTTRPKLFFLIINLQFLFKKHIECQFFFVILQHPFRIIENIHD